MSAGVPSEMAGFWIRWVVANAVGELLGLGPVALIGVTLARVLGESGGAAAALVSLMLFSALGAFEGAVVGYAQWLVLRSHFRAMPARSWTMATAIGAAIAWFMGMLPATAAFSSEGPVSVGEHDEFAMVTMSLIEVGMGAVLGAVLAAPQWLVLRRHVDRAVWWLPANAVAWTVAMPLVFLAAGADLMQFGMAPAIAAVIALIAGAGALAGAIHGLVLVRLLTAVR